MISNLEVMTKINTAHTNILKTYIQKYGLNIKINKAQIVETIDDLNVFNDETNITKLNQKQNDTHNIEIDTNTIETKMLLVDTESLPMLANNTILNGSNFDDMGLSDKLNVFINSDEIFNVGTKIAISDYEQINYKIDKIFKPISKSTILKYLIVRD